ncbi:VWA domain-containing protein [Nannocystis sp. SCPEA4]|uniref:vWA domain-containing protein n=1 Tax=Nannocystis sp. SCPEA4 TaxID=2996787 RepID=UPI00226FE9F2|nr:VWA domain-containing protein [Nannocystis sp. SCPEA4]MCY1061874.1 VWA domain-containing protein [Nannocystis sp. SCPEA4]
MPTSRLSSLVPPLLTMFALFVTSGCTGKGPAEPRREAAASEPAKPQVEAPMPQDLGWVTTTGSVKLEVLPQYDLLDRRTGTLDVNLLIRLRGMGEVVGERPPLDLAVVLDRSGSMAGEKLLAVKQATLDLLKELRPHDHLTLIAYDDEVEVLTERIVADVAGLETARKAVLGIMDRGGTALGPALFRGFEIFDPKTRKEGELRHLMLLSDGQANVGEKDPLVLGQRAREGFGLGVSVSTLGVGLDYNEELMTRLADQGGGRYHFIQGTDAIPRVLSDEFAGLVATVASGIEVTMQMAPGVQVKRVYGYAWQERPSGASILVGSLAAQQVREIVVRLQVNFGAGSEGQLALGTVALRAKDQTQQGRAVEGTLAMSAPTSADEAAIRRSERTEVTVRVAEVESAEQMQVAAVAVDGGDYDKARKVLQDSVLALEAQQKVTPSPKLSKQIDELKEAESGLDAARQSAEQAKIYGKQKKAKAYKLGK